MLAKQTDYIVGIYLRLSKDDERAGESLSIENQRRILTNYVREQGWTIYDEYVDAFTTDRIQTNKRSTTENTQNCDIFGSWPYFFMGGVRSTVKATDAHAAGVVALSNDCKAFICIVQPSFI